MERQELEKYLPHRENMLLLDSCQKIDDKHAVANYKIKGDEFFLQGHFPDNPVVPGVILCEIMAQSCCVLISNSLQKGIAYFTGIKEAKFKDIVRPGDQLFINVELIRKVTNFYFAKGTITVDDKVVALADFSFAVFEDK
ncbi:MAG: 3-hydroxyacyl-ACP dehydratase FabZ [Clostridiales bacterium]|jgi:3-hydroxyacyl-[acyl-carrier-protein] dehydratase|nr:3-hydroxyacyl-ACP dehydratase FabZ [Clostridiales bacterium]